MKSPSDDVVAWYCHDCGRMEGPRDEKYCPQCAEKRIRCSRYEWFLYDQIDGLLALSGREYRIGAQYPIPDHRGFTWYFDIYVWVVGASLHGGYGELIEVNGQGHKFQARYSGPGGGYTRDYDKMWEVLNNLRLHKRGIELRVVSNDDCTYKGDAVRATAVGIVHELIERADTWC